MANFNLKVEDLFDADNFGKSTAKEINKFLPDGFGPNLVTSRSKDKTASPLNLTMFNLSEILMKVPAMRSVEDVLSELETVMTGTVGTLYDEIRGLPGGKAITSLIPEDIRNTVDKMNPDDTGKEDKDNKDQGSTETAGDVSSIASADVKGLISVARSTVGITESPAGSNMTKFHKEMGVGACYWCALWIMWCFKKAGISAPQITASCQNTFNNYSKMGRVSSTEPKVGALCFFQYSRNNNLNHIGIVIGFDDTTITTIEGNTSSSNKGDQSNGGGVFEKKHQRGAKELRWYAYPVYPGTAPPAGTTTTTTTAPARVQ